MFPCNHCHIDQGTKGLKDYHEKVCDADQTLIFQSTGQPHMSVFNSNHERRYASSQTRSKQPTEIDVSLGLPHLIHV